MKGFGYLLKNSKNELTDGFQNNRRIDSWNNNKIIMTSQLIIRQGIIFFDSEIQFHHKLSLKVCHKAQIYKFHDFDWNISGHRWQRKEPIKMPWPDAEEVNLEVYSNGKGNVPRVLGEGKINMSYILSYLCKEIRVVFDLLKQMLTYDGLYVGSMYCEVSNQEGEDHSSAKKFLYVHKIDILFLEDLDYAFEISVRKNDEKVYEKDFHLTQKNKTLFPNIKVPVKMSDIFTVFVSSSELYVKEIKFLVDTIRRGKTSIYEVWLRNQNKNKVGDLKIEYFLENLYLDNERQLCTRNGILGKSLINPGIILTEQDNEKKRRSVIIRQIMEVDRRFLKIERGMRKLIKNIETKQSKKTLKKILSNEEKSKENVNPSILKVRIKKATFVERRQ